MFEWNEYSNFDLFTCVSISVPTTTTSSSTTLLPTPTPTQAPLNFVYKENFVNLGNGIYIKEYNPPDGRPCQKYYTGLGSISDILTGCAGREILITNDGSQYEYYYLNLWNFEDKIRRTGMIPIYSFKLRTGTYLVNIPTANVVGAGTLTNKGQLISPQPLTQEEVLSILRTPGSTTSTTSTTSQSNTILPCWPVSGRITQGPPGRPSECPTYDAQGNIIDKSCSHDVFNEQAIDIGANTGTPVYATHYGVATFYIGDGYGNYVDIKSPRGFTTRYAHLSKIEENLKKGVSIELTAGTKIGETGTGGTGPHLHYELLPKGAYIDEYVPSYKLNDYITADPNCFKSFIG